MHANDLSFAEVKAKIGTNATIPCSAAEKVSRIFKLEWWREDRKLVEVRLLVDLIYDLV